MIARSRQLASSGFPVDEHQAAEVLILRHEMGLLSPDEEAALREHLAHCEQCRAEADRMGEELSMIRASSQLEVGAVEWRRLHTAIENQRALARMIAFGYASNLALFSAGYAACIAAGWDHLRDECLTLVIGMIIALPAVWWWRRRLARRLVDISERRAADESARVDRFADRLTALTRWTFPILFVGGGLAMVAIAVLLAFCPPVAPPVRAVARPAAGMLFLVATAASILGFARRSIPGGRAIRRLGPSLAMLGLTVVAYVDAPGLLAGGTERSTQLVTMAASGVILLLLAGMYYSVLPTAEHRRARLKDLRRMYRGEITWKQFMELQRNRRSRRD